MKKLLSFFCLLVVVVGTVYLCLPAPKDFPYLPNSIKSVEPGDTTQIVNVAAYYTDLPRQEVVDFYFRYFSRSSFLNIPLLTYKLNHPPERIREVLRETQRSTYVEEIIHPLRESVFVNGFEWDNDPFTLSSKRIKNILIVDGRTYRFKITLFYQESELWQRLVIFYACLLFFILIPKTYLKIFREIKKKSK